MAADLYLAEITVYVPGSGVTTLRFATRGFATGPAETPANTYYDGRLKQPGVIRRDVFSDGTTFGRSRVGYGDILLINDDGALDVLLTYGFDGRTVTIRRGTVGAAYPGGFSTIFAGTMEQPEAGQSVLVIKLRDMQAALEVPLQKNKYAGDNVLPAGLEGGADDLKGKPKPRCFGSALNVPVPCVNTSKLIYQVNDGAVASVDAVHDSGIRLSTGLWTTASAFANFDEVWACCYAKELGLYVAVGYDTVGLTGRIRTSPDGITWTARTGAAAEIALMKWYTVCWSPALSLFVVAGTAGVLSTSPDGVTWTARVSGTVQRIIDCAWSPDAAVFVYGAATGVCASSVNGTAWTARTSNSGGNDINGLAWGNGLFVGACSGGYLITSPDGITWTSRTNSFAGAVVRSVCYGAGLSGIGSFVGCGDGGVVITSVDGSTWAISRLTGVTTNLYRVGFGSNGFVIVGQTGTVLLSSDGVKWTIRTGGHGTSYIYHLAYGAIYGWLLVGDVSKYSISLIYDTYANSADLLDDTKAPAAGEAKVYLAGGYIRLGSPPAGLITADVTEGASAAARTAGQVFVRVLQGAGYGTGAWSASDVTALDAAIASEIGLWTGSEETTIAEVLDAIAASAGAWWGVDRTGVFRIKQLTAPSGTASLAFTANDLLKPLERLATNDEARGLPPWRTIIRYQRNYSVQATDLAGGVTDARRAFLAKEWREAKAENRAVLAEHLLAPQIVEETPLATLAGAQAEANRRQALRDVLRHRYEIVVALTDETQALDLGDVVSLTHSRYALSSGVLFRVIGMESDAASRELKLTLWGPSDPTSRVAVAPPVLAGVGTAA